MYIRLKRQRARHGNLIIAQVVESKRIAGQPRQKVIAYLGSIREHRLNCVPDRARFWETADDIIITLPDAEKLRGQLLKHIPRPAVAEIKQYEIESERRMTNIIKILQTA